METRWYNASRKQNDIAAAILFGPTEPPMPFQDHLMQLFAASDNRNVNVWKFGEKLAAIADMDNSVSQGVRGGRVGWGAAGCGAGKERRLSLSC